MDWSSCALLPFVCHGVGAGSAGLSLGVGPSSSFHAAASDQFSSLLRCPQDYQVFDSSGSSALREELKAAMGSEHPEALVELTRSSALPVPAPSTHTSRPCPFHTHSPSLPLSHTHTF